MLPFRNRQSKEKQKTSGKGLPSTCVQQWPTDAYCMAYSYNCLLQKRIDWHRDIKLKDQKKSLEAEEEAKRERIQAQKQKHREEQRIKVP